jgi:hypothetical protein
MAPDLKLEGSLSGAADYLGSMPLAALKGTATATGKGTATSELLVGVTVAYEDGKVTFDADAELSAALELLFALDASLAAEVFGEEAWGATLNLVDWRWSRAWPILGRVHLGMSSGTAKEPKLEFHADALSLTDVLRAMLDEAIDPGQILAGMRGSSAGTASPMLDPTAALVTRAAIEADDLPTALDVVVRSLPIDTSLCTISFVDDSSQGDGGTQSQFDQGGGLAIGPSTVSIYRPAFASVPWLVSTVMHEYQHVIQHHTQGMTAQELTDKGASGIAHAAADTEAYLWEIEHSVDTGVFERPEELRDIGERLMRNFELLGAGDRERQEGYRDRVDAAMEFVDAVTGLQAPPLPNYANIFHHGTDYDTAERLGTADIGAIGGNDFGRGFYTHSKENWKLAKEWAVRVSRGKRGWGVVTFPIPDDVWEEEIVEVMIFENPRHQPDNIPINPDTGRKFRDWREFVEYNKRFRRDRLPEWPELQVIIGPLWGRYENNARVRQVVFTSTGVPVLNRPESKAERIVYVRRNPRGAARGP